MSPVALRASISISLYLRLSIYPWHFSACSLCQEITGQSRGCDSAEISPLPESNRRSIRILYRYQKEGEKRKLEDFGSEHRVYFKSSDLPR